MTNVEKDPKQVIKELQQQIKDLKSANESLSKENDMLKQNCESAYKKAALVQEEAKELLLRARAQLQLYRDTFKQNYSMALQLKEI